MAINTPTEMDSLLSDYIEGLWQEGEAKAWAADAVSGFTYFIPAAKGNLVEAWRLLKTWQKNEAPNRARCLLPEQSCAMVGFALEGADVEMAAALQLHFHTFLRTGELLGVQTKDVHINVANCTAVIGLGWTKGAQRSGAVESVICEDCNACVLLSLAFEKKQPGDFLITRPMHQYRRDFARLVVSIGGNPDCIKPYSCRRGGATHFFRSTGNMSRACEMGRWRHLQTARVYINEGLQELSAHALTAKERKAIGKGMVAYNKYL